MADEKRKKMNIPRMFKMKKSGEKITMITAYDNPSARILDNAGMEIMLVGDSVGNTTLGYADTIPVTMDQMISHTAAVSRGAKYAFVIGDMPFMSYQISVESAVMNAGRFIKEGRADGIKLEGGRRVAPQVKAITDAGIPVMGHLGLTPQSTSMFGGYFIQGKTAKSAREVLADSQALVEAGVFAILLELVTAETGKLVTEKVDVPVIGIGAGPHTNGQLLIYHDVMGIEAVYNPSFVKRYADIEKEITKGAKAFISEIKECTFPSEKQTFRMKEEEAKKL